MDHEEPSLSCFMFSPYANPLSAYLNHEQADKENYLYSRYGASAFHIMCFESTHQAIQTCSTTQKKIKYYCAPKNEALQIFEEHFQVFYNTVKRALQESKVTIQTETILLKTFVDLKEMWIKQIFGQHPDDSYCLLDITLLAEDIALENMADILTHNRNEHSIYNTFHCILNAKELPLLTGHFALNDHMPSNTEEPRTQSWISFYEQKLQLIPADEIKMIDQYLRNALSPPKSPVLKSIV
ncbi:MAG: hypothetical protein Q8K36_04835, partial [Alphaproteobacteria bacterium]|nr:hypothetical protein [Alphaproteobacteria bacterium]